MHMYRVTSPDTLRHAQTPRVRADSKPLAALCLVFGPPSPRASEKRLGCSCPHSFCLLSLPVVAFLVAFHQNKQLIGDRGLLPCRLYLRSVQQHFRGGAGWDAVSYAPTLLWLLDWSHMDSNLDAIALLGLGISSFILVTGCANMVLMAALWVLYMSLVNVGQVW